MFKYDVCVLNHMWIKSKRFLFFLFAFGSDLYHPCFSKFFKLILCEKHISWVFSWLISWINSVASLDREFRECLVSNLREVPTWEVPAKIPMLAVKISRSAFQRALCETFVLSFSHLPPNPYFNVSTSKPN